MVTSSETKMALTEFNIEPSPLVIVEVKGVTRNSATTVFINRKKEIFTYSEVCLPPSYPCTSNLVKNLAACGKVTFNSETTTAA
mmetsp:Transcript_22864/g.33849  ORF Transcript_22864/g.33849 Transcript_22864/m.33849 type:complete len:84 (+) Transcript_22864:1201-1452(+)